MLAILRVATQKSRLEALLDAASLQPSRIEKAPNWTPDGVELRFQLLDSEASFSEDLRALAALLRNHEEALQNFRNADCGMVLELGVGLDEEQYQVFARIGAEFMRLMAFYDIDLEISVSKTWRVEELD